MPPYFRAYKSPRTFSLLI